MGSFERITEPAGWKNVIRWRCICLGPCGRLGGGGAPIGVEDRLLEGRSREFSSRDRLTDHARPLEDLPASMPPGRREHQRRGFVGPTGLRAR